MSDRLYLERWELKLVSGAGLGLPVEQSRRCAEAIREIALRT